MRLPDPQRSYAVLIGTSTYRSRELADLPAVRNNLDSLTEVLTDPALGGLPAEQCLVLCDSTDVRTVYRTLRQYATLAQDTLLVYFAGHGHPDLRNELYLSLSDTDPDELRVSALPFDLLREILSDSPAINRVLILDCCFSGRAIPDMSGLDETILGQVGIEGTYTLTATPANAVALAPIGAPYTAFTGELLTLLRTGVRDGPELLTFATIYRHLLHTLTTRGLPRPRQRGTDTVDQLALTRNPAHPANQLLPSRTYMAVPHRKSDAVQDRGVEFGQSRLRLLYPLGLFHLIIFLAYIWILALFLFLVDEESGFLFLIISIMVTVLLLLRFATLFSRLSKARLIVEQVGLTITRTGERTAYFPWDELSSVEFRRESGLFASKLYLIGTPKIGSALWSDNRNRKSWTKEGFIRIFDATSIDGSPRELSATLAHYSGGRYQTKGSDMQ